MLRKITLLVTGMVLVLITGTFWGIWFALSRTLYAFSAETFVLFVRQITQNVAVGLGILMPLATIGMVLLLLMAGKRKKLHFYWGLAALALFAAAFIITLFIEMPLGNQLKNWTTGNLPANWQAMRDRWLFYHANCTFISLAGMVCYLLATIKRYS